MHVSGTQPETADFDRPRFYARVLVFTICLSALIATLRFAGIVAPSQPGALVDFDAFYLAGKLAWQGAMASAYRYAEFGEVQRAVSGGYTFLPWTYPPQFDLIAAMLAAMPRGLAYPAFVATTLAPFLVVLRREAGRSFAAILALVYVPILVTITCGQNGFLTATLIGLACPLLLRRSAWAGVPLGLMIIKPHLAVAIAIWVLADRQWRTVGVGAATIAATALLATGVFGTGIWPAFAGGVGEASHHMANGLYPFFRMVSAYSTARSLGAPHVLSLVLQAGVAVVALAATLLAKRRLSARTSLGVAVAATLLVSPYAYDYDLPILGIGLALLFPALVAATRLRERFPAYVLIVVAGLVGFTQSAATLPPFGSGDTDNSALVSLAGYLLVAGCALLFRLLQRQPQAAALVVERRHLDTPPEHEGVRRDLERRQVDIALS